MTENRPRGLRLPPERARRLLDLAARLTGHGGMRSPRVERMLMVLALLLFAGATVFAWDRLPEAHREAHLGWAMLAGGLAVLTLWLNALEFGLSARMLGNRIPAGEAIRVSVLGSAANILPIPGAVLIRTRALRQAGEGTRDALVVTGAVGIAWIGAAAALAGVLLLAFGGAVTLSAIFLLCGAAAWLVTIGLVRVVGKTTTGPPISALAALEISSVVVSGIRLFAIARAADFDVGVVGAVTVNLGAVLSNVVGILPGGLGLREISSGLFGGMVGVSPSVGILMSVLDRIVLYVVLGLAVLGLWLAGHHPGAGATPHGGEARTS